MVQIDFLKVKLIKNGTSEFAYCHYRGNDIDIRGNDIVIKRSNTAMKGIYTVIRGVTLLLVVLYRNLHNSGGKGKPMSLTDHASDINTINK